MCRVELKPPTRCFTGYGCLHFCILCTFVDEQWGLYACRNKLYDPQRHSFHFEQVLFQVMQRLLYQHAKNADRQTDDFSALYSRLTKYKV